MGKLGRRGYRINPLAHLWLERKPLEPPRAVWIARVELGSAIAISLIFWAMVVIYVLAAIQPLTTTEPKPVPTAIRKSN